MSNQNRAYFPDTIRTASGEVVPVENFENKVLWSSGLIGSDQSNDTELFRYSKGDDVTGANNESVKSNERYTNVEDKGTMDAKSAMNVWSIGIEFEYNAAKTALGQLLDRMYLEYKLSSGRPVYEGLVRHFPAGNGMFAQSTATADAVYSNGQPNQQRFQFTNPMLLSASTRYGATAKILDGALSMASADILMRVVFRGLGVSAA